MFLDLIYKYIVKNLYKTYFIMDLEAEDHKNKGNEFFKSFIFYIRQKL